MSLKSRCPSVYRDLLQAGEAAERWLRDCADIEFTFDNGALYVTSVRKARLLPLENTRVQLQLLVEGLTAPEEFLERIRPTDVAQFLRPEIVDKARLELLGKGLPAGGGAASGRIAIWRSEADDPVIPGCPPPLILSDRHAPSLHATKACAGMLTRMGGISSHAAMLCRQLGKPCIVGFQKGELSHEEHLFTLPGHAPLHAGDWLTIDGITGEVFAGQAQIETRPWKSHSELRSLWLIIAYAVTSGHVPANCAGNVWRIWDFMRHELPLPGQPNSNQPTKNSPRRRALPNRENPVKARTNMVQIETVDRQNYSEIICGLLTAIERRLGLSAGGKSQSHSRVLWEIGSPICLQEQSQLVGFEFTGLNQHDLNLIEVSSIRFELECEVQSPAEAWTAESIRGGGSRMIPNSRIVKRCRIMVNGVPLKHEDIPQFYTWLRRREYF
ncbi:MAG: PEP-utilizing enzyme [Verrucomicrobiota bacterium]